TEFLSEERASDLDEAQICDVRHDAPAIGIEKHHLHLCPDMRPIDGGHSQQSFRKAFQSNANHWSIGHVWREYESVHVRRCAAHRPLSLRLFLRVRRESRLGL